MARTPEQQREYMRVFRARKKAEQQESAGLSEPSTATPQQPTQPDVAPAPAVFAAGKSWKSAEAFVAAQPDIVLSARDVHAECLKAEKRSWAREEAARADYAAMLGILKAIATAKEQSPGSQRYIVYGDLMARILAVTDDVHERERQAAEFAVDMDEPF